MKYILMALLVLAIGAAGLFCCGNTFNIGLKNDVNISKTDNNAEQNNAPGSSVTNTNTTGIKSNDNTEPEKIAGKGNGFMGGLEFWGVYGATLKGLLTILLHLAILAVIIIPLVGLIKKQLVLAWLPKMWLAIIVSAIIGVLRIGIGYLIQVVFSYALNPVGEIIIDSLLAPVLVHFFYNAFVKGKLFKRD